MRRWVNLYSDILHIYFSTYYRMLSDREFEKVAPEDRFRRIKVMLKTLQKRISQMGTPDFQAGAFREAEGRLWLFAVSKNNLDTLAFIHNAIADSVFLLDKPRKEFASYRSVVPNLRWQILHLFGFPCLLYFLIKQGGVYARRLSPVILRSIGFYEEWTRILKKAKPKAIVFSNDHNIESRSLLLAAGSLGIPTVYLQHASVSSSFPPLKFDLSLLEGQDSFQKYQQIGPINGRVELVGMAKFDEYLKHRRKITEIERIGIPYNLNDDPNVLGELIIKLHRAFPKKLLTVRRHPKDKRDCFLVHKYPFLMDSDPLTESAFDFLTKQDCIIAGNSSIHLEATLLNIASIYFNMDKGSFIDDYYGYVKNGLVDAAVNIEGVIDLVNAGADFERFLKARYYNANVSTEWEGKTQKLILSNISEFVNGDEAADQA